MAQNFDKFDEFLEFFKILPIKVSFLIAVACKADTIRQNFTCQFFLIPNSSQFSTIKILRYMVLIKNLFNYLNDIHT